MPQPFSDSRPLHVLVVGAGSAGKRHARNLRALGVRVSACDPRADRLQEISQDGPVAGAYGTLAAALSATTFDGCVIASPPRFHVVQALEVMAAQRQWTLCEKPLSIDAAEARSLVPHGDRVLLAYTYRWWPPVQSFRQRLQAGEIGTVRNMRFTMSAHLADWHPWEKYQDFFMAHRELGGGALLDESHFIDLMLWMLGAPHKVYAHVDKISSLDIDSDDNVDILASYASGVRVNLHLDLIGRPHERSITAVGDEGTLSYSYETNVVRVGKSGGDWVPTPFRCERNDMFVGAAEEFLELIRGERETPSCTIDDGIRALDVVDACRRSSQTGAAVVIGG